MAKDEEKSKKSRLVTLRDMNLAAGASELEILKYIISISSSTSPTELMDMVSRLPGPPVSSGLGVLAMGSALNIRDVIEEVRKRASISIPDEWQVDGEINFSQLALLGHIIYLLDDENLTDPAIDAKRAYQKSIGGVDNIQAYTETSVVEGKAERTEILKKWAKSLAGFDVQKHRNTLGAKFPSLVKDTRNIVFRSFGYFFSWGKKSKAKRKEVRSSNPFTKLLRFIVYYSLVIVILMSSLSLASYFFAPNTLQAFLSVGEPFDFVITAPSRYEILPSLAAVASKAFTTSGQVGIWGSWSLLRDFFWSIGEASALVVPAASAARKTFRGESGAGMNFLKSDLTQDVYNKVSDAYSKDFGNIWIAVTEKEFPTLDGQTTTRMIGDIKKSFFMDLDLNTGRYPETYDYVLNMFAAEAEAPAKEGVQDNVTAADIEEEDSPVTDEGVEHEETNDSDELDKSNDQEEDKGEEEESEDQDQPDEDRPMEKPAVEEESSDKEFSDDAERPDDDANEFDISKEDNPETELPSDSDDRSDYDLDSDDVDDLVESLLSDEPGNTIKQEEPFIFGQDGEL